jgi:hypothetical protein
MTPGRPPTRSTALAVMLPGHAKKPRRLAAGRAFHEDL